jgi:crotonobetainyl-CoA:carnitine CoA-transferase CaiB-like acyl-CoA transferase
MTAPLKGIRVLELARILAGPWSGQLLADLGADVVKVERPGAGDDTRQWGPPFIATTDGDHLSASYYHATNRGKRSVDVDFESDEGQKIVRRLAAHADVVIENFKVGGLAKYGLDYKSLAAVNPRLIYCSVTGFGQTGPYAPRPGYDFLLQGLGGIMSITGEPEGEPMKAGVAFADVFTGMYSTVAILAALQGRAASGKGCHIDMALLDSQVAVLGNQALYYLASGEVPPRMGNEHTSVVPYGVFPTADGHVIIACGNDGQFERLAALLGAPQWAKDPRYATNPARLGNRKTLIPAVTERTRTFKKTDLMAKMVEIGVPVGAINDMREVFEDPQVIARRMRVDLKHPRAKGGSIPSVRSPIVIDGAPMFAERPSPEVGSHTGEVLTDPAWGGKP